MASKPVPAKKKPASSKSSSPMPPEPEVTVLKKASCPTLSQTGTIDYAIILDNTGAILIGLTGNSGAGYFSKARQPVTDVIDVLKDFEAKFPITSLAFKDLYPGTSINSWSFLMAVLLAEGLVEPLEDNKRRYKLCDVDAFMKSLDKLKGQHTTTAKANPKAKSKAAASMKKPQKKPATGK